MSLFLIFAIALIGAILITTASSPVAERLKLDSFYFVHRQFIFLCASLFIMILIASIEERNLKRFILIGFVTSLIFMVYVLIFGEEVKGSRRWCNLLGFSLQPSELLKPFYIFIIGMILSEKYNRRKFPSFQLAILIHLVVLGLLILQPDFGMVVTYSVVLVGQMFFAGLSAWWIFFGLMLGVIGGVSAYFLLPHVAKRIDAFIGADGGSDSYQIEKSMESYASGGLFGRGPGEGVVKSHLPDSHTDFIFAVSGEEFGAITSSLILLVFLSFILRALFLLYKTDNLMKIYICGGIVVLFALQTIFNVGVTLHLFPTKGMTLPFISYGGSSMLSFAIAFGIFLNFTRKQNNVVMNNNGIILT